MHWQPHTHDMSQAGAFVYQFFFPELNRYYIGAKKMSNWSEYNSSSKAVHSLVGAGFACERTILTTTPTWDDALELESLILEVVGVPNNKTYLNKVVSWDGKGGIAPKQTRLQKAYEKIATLEARITELEAIVELEPNTALEVTPPVVYRAKYDPKRV